MSVRWDERRERWVADFYDEFGRRRAPTFIKKTDAQREERKGRSKRKRRVTVDPAVTFEKFKDQWLAEAGLRVTPQTLDGYKAAMRDHFGGWGSWPMLDVDREAIRELLAAKLRAGYRRSTVGRLLVTLSGLYSHAVDRGLLDANPCKGLGKALGLRSGNPRQRSKGGSKVKALESQHLSALLRETQADSDLHAAACLMAWAGLRQGEVIGFKWEDCLGPRLRVARTAVRRYETNEPKGRSERLIPCSPELADVLRELKARRGAEALKHGRPVSAWLFPEMDDPRPSVIGRLQGRLDRGIREAGARAGVQASCHQLRHTFATQLLLAGESVAKVQQWLGHESVSTTVDTYGSWLPHDDSGGLAALSKATAPKS